MRYSASTAQKKLWKFRCGASYFHVVCATVEDGLVVLWKCDDTMTTRLRPSSCCRRLEKPLPTAKACLSFGHCLDCVSELRGRISLEIPHLSRGNRTLAQLATSFSISELRPLQLWIQFCEKTRGVVHSRIGCTDFKTWKKFLGFFRFFSGFFWVYQDFMNKKRFKH